MKLLRLKAVDDFSWLIWPQVRQRIWESGQRLSPGMNSNNMVSDIQSKWVSNPNMVAVWVAFEEPVEGTIPTVLGHLVGSVELIYGEPKILILQADGTEGYAAPELKGPFKESCREWIDELNALYEKANSPIRIETCFRLMTERDSAFYRYFAPDARRLYTMIEVDLSNVGKPEEKKSNGALPKQDLGFGPLGS